MCGGKFSLFESHHMQLLLLQLNKQTQLQHLEEETHFDPRICGW